MKITELKDRQDITSNKSLKNTYSQFETLLEELRKRDLPQNVIESINKNVEEIDSSTETDHKLRTLLIKKQTKILALVKKELRLLPKNHYTFQWMILGMSVFGLPIGVIYGKIVDNMGLLAIGLPIGLGIGILVGMWLDNKVEKEGRQLNFN